MESGQEEQGVVHRDYEKRATNEPYDKTRKSLCRA
jgi:hypothetical protein